MPKYNTFHFACNLTEWSFIYSLKLLGMVDGVAEYAHAHSFALDTKMKQNASDKWNQLVNSMISICKNCNKFPT